LTEKVEPRAVDLSEVRDAIKKELMDQAQQAGMEELIKNLRSKAHIRINEKLLEGSVQ
jgi:hypothetical protein